MTVFFQDTARNNLISWTRDALTEGYGIGAVLSPFASPINANGFKKSAIETSELIRARGGEFWFDSMTYALDMPRAGDFRNYEEWPLWSSAQGQLANAAEYRSHAERALKVQVDLGSTLLAPTVLVSYPDTPQSQKALHLTAEALDLASDAWATVAGDHQFWTGGAELDAHVGALDQLEPEGWLLVVVRSDTSMPPAATAEEIFGLMRTVYALSRDRPVRVAFGDVAALPAVAAGAEAIGTGWDMRQRICAYQDFEERVADSGGGGWYQRPTLSGLLGGLTPREYQVLVSEKPAIAATLSPGAIGPRPQQAFRHHSRVLTDVCDQLEPLTGRDRAEALQSRYAQALIEWPGVQKITGASLGAAQWIKPFQDGLNLFMVSEGWA
ncbi:hypothetical protein [Leekyejoonella antrihumi]|uniref:Uncharacterized protein n=1 Tax=Leekyejoonella antrihumi TaxID=1660198 RepID=A0A563DRM9_9MICO|nr:hypothetical protein [Leekyejoonella antrihumi]TWP32591.1 hypothetical protein FGL98_23865 [Leekyejoonella antrihumi]